MPHGSMRIYTFAGTAVECLGYILVRFHALISRVLPVPVASTMLSLLTVDTHCYRRKVVPSELLLRADREVCHRHC